MFFFFIYLFLAALGLYFCSRVFSPGEQRAAVWLWCMGFSLQRLLLLQNAGSVVVGHRLSCSEACGGLPGPGMEPTSPARAGRFFTTAPPEKSLVRVTSSRQLWLCNSLLVPGSSLCGCAFVQYRGPEQSNNWIGSISFNAGCKMLSLLF